MATLNINNLGNAQAIGWADAAITRNAAGRIALPALTMAQGTIAAAAAIIDAAATWNNAAVTFTGIKANITNTASNAASLLMDLQVGGLSQFSVRKDGLINLTRLGIAAATISAGDYNGEISFGLGSAGYLNGNSIAIQLRSDGSLRWCSTTTNDGNATTDLQLYRDAAGVLAQRNSTNAQTLRTYGTYTDASNYRRVALAMTTAGVATLLPEGAGTGASGNVIHISGLPTSNPGVGILWNNAGTPAIGT